MARSAVTEEQLTANVVDIRRFSTHDGHGIRTTIFLKGCSLECAWCQNPEAIDPRIAPVFFRSRCIDCGLCLDRSAHGEVTRDADGAIAVDTAVTEADWETLSRVCPTGAITFDSRRYTVAELVEVARRDRVFFGAGGGVTLSGGEPLFLPHFAAALLKALQADGMNTALETALNVRQEFLLDALPHVNSVFADCKLLDPELHRRHTGHTNERILGNLQTLLTGERRDDVTVRTPLIPGITDTEENIAGIARFISGIYPDVHYELLNYNPLAAAKYDLLPGVAYVFDTGENPQMFSKTQMGEFRELARSNGVHNLVTI
ncbi:MAG: glycyl-radical enzyme activating protein [Propioniciclava sp.]